MKIFAVLILFSNSAIFAQPKSQTFKFSDSTSIQFAQSPKDGNRIANFDIAHKSPKIYFQGGWAPVAYTKSDMAFQQKYAVKFEDFGCVSPDETVLKAYNKTVFEYLTKRFGAKWKTEIRKDVIGFSDKKQTAFR